MAVKKTYAVESADKCAPPSVSRFRRIFAQALATTVKNLLLFDVGLCFSLPTIVIAALKFESQNDQNRDEFLSITPIQASWLSSIGYLIQPFGSILSAMLADPLGRRLSMILVNIPYLIGWYTLYQATSVAEIFIGFLMLGLAVGLMEAPVVTYLGEICEPSTRGVLIGYTFICASIGMLTIFVLNTLMPWRTVALICSAVPVITAVSVYFIPETPQWLLSKNRTAEAKKSLQWLRGWAPEHTIEQEFDDLQRHSERSNSCNLCIKKNVSCAHQSLPTMREKFAELKRKQTLKPFAIVMGLFFLAQFSGVFAMRPFIMQIFKAYNSPIEPDRTAAVMSLMDNLANVVFMCLVRFTGKRRLYLTMLSGMFVCAFTVTVYGFVVLPSGYISFASTEFDSFNVQNENLTYIPLVCLLLWSFFSFCGVASAPWMFLSELFPFKSRGVANGVAAALNYLFGFITKKTYYNLETTLSLPGTALFYCIICCIGLIFTYNVLPETEGRTLEDIELHFADNSKTIRDRKILKKSKKSTNSNGNGKTMKEISSTVDMKYGTMGTATVNGNAQDNKAFEYDEDCGGQNV